EHFNILETTKELLRLINQSNSSFLTTKELKKFKSLNSAYKRYVFLSNLPEWCSQIILKLCNLGFHQEELNTEYKQTKYTYSSFQHKLICEINENEQSNSLFESVYWDIVSKGWKDYDKEK